MNSINKPRAVASLKTLSQTLSWELKLLICVTGIFALSFSLLDRSHYMSGFNLLKTELNLLVEPIDSIQKINVEKLLSNSMSYSYKSARLAFSKSSNSVFTNFSKSELESILLTSLPSSLQHNASKYVRAILKLSELHQIDPIWVMSVMWTESHFKYSAKSWAGASGLMQIMPATRKFVYRTYKRRSNLLVVEQEDFNINEYYPYRVSKELYNTHIKKLVNIELGIIYLKDLLETFKDNHTYATVAYNMGPGWTRVRLRKNLPVGTDNQYLDKVQRAYKKIVTKI